MSKYLFTFFILFLFIDLQRTEAQRNITYQNLVERSEQPNIYIDYIGLPSPDGRLNYIVSFRMEYELLPFRRVRSDMRTPGPDVEFLSNVRMNLEVFRGSIQNRRRQGFEPVARSSWSDTAWAETYEQTRSRTEFLEGAINTKLDPGEYNLILQLNRGETTREARSRERTFNLPDLFEATDKAVFVLISSFDEYDNRVEARLLNYGENVLYGENYELMVVLPQQPDETEFDLKINRGRTGSENGGPAETLFERRISTDEMHRTEGFMRLDGKKDPHLTFNKSESGFHVAFVEIPNSTYPNVPMTISLTPAGNNTPIGERAVNSRWINMPVSLLNLEVAIDMLRFIVSEDQLRQMSRGNRAERESKFREFWKERDPTPETEFNELMMEYYRRIDHAYQNFTTPERPGYESDQGLVYIRRGEPDRRERRYPTDGPTREIWYYGSQSIVFEATTGFGDFRRVSQ